MFFSTTDLCLDMDHLSCEKNWTHMPSTRGSYGRQVDRQAGRQSRSSYIIFLLKFSRG